MLKNTLAEKIQERGKGLKCSDIAERSGLLHETMSKILRGETKNPGVYTIAKIATALNCSINELVGQPSQIDPPVNIKINNDELFLTVINFVFKKIRGRTCDIYSSNLIKTVMNIYSYCESQNKLDTKFAEWCIEKQLLT